MVSDALRPGVFRPIPTAGAIITLKFLFCFHQDPDRLVDLALPNLFFYLVIHFNTLDVPIQE